MQRIRTGLLFYQDEFFSYFHCAHIGAHRFYGVRGLSNRFPIAPVKLLLQGDSQFVSLLIESPNQLIQ